MSKSQDALAFVTYLSIFAIRKRSGKDARSWLSLLLLVQSIARAGMVILGPALVATLVHPAFAAAIVFVGLLAAVVDMQGALSFPHLWDPKTGETMYDQVVVALLVGTPQMIASDSSTLCHASSNPQLTQWGLDYMAVPIWLVGASAGLLAHEHATASISGDPEMVAHTFASLNAVLVVFASCCASWFALVLFLRCLFANGRAAAKEKAYTYWQGLQDRRAKVRADYTDSIGAFGIAESGWIAKTLYDNDASEAPTPREPEIPMSYRGKEMPAESGWIAKKLYENDVSSQTTTPRDPGDGNGGVPVAPGSGGWIAETLYDIENSKRESMEPTE